MSMDKLDLRKQLRHLYQPSANKVEVVDVPTLKFAMIDGVTEPGCLPGNSPAFQDAVKALYSISYALKFASKQRTSIDYTVMPLEALWWVEDGVFDISKPHNWHWTAMIMQPEHITDAMFEEAMRRSSDKQPSSALGRLRLEAFSEGLCMQTMHVGPYSSEPETISRMEAFAAEMDYALRGKHHEIYIGDPRRSAPERLKTVIRQPIRPKHRED